MVPTLDQDKLLGTTVLHRHMAWRDRAHILSRAAPLPWDSTTFGVIPPLGSTLVVVRAGEQPSGQLGVPYGIGIRRSLIRAICITRFLDGRAGPRRSDPANDEELSFQRRSINSPFPRTRYNRDTGRRCGGVHNLRRTVPVLPAGLGGPISHI